MSARAQIAPRLLTRQQAAAYCNVSIGLFNLTCPVRPIAMGDGPRYERFDVRSLDAWIDRINGEVEQTAADWLSRA